ncbi:hypothetical protein ACFY7H_29540 [Streptomyces sp. NPDC012794]|uniref:hypothetical protein n=1 Tax=Streptomyces sp. NPDC012794 TaxID=3364850 RepID=UPI0036A9D7B1
MSDDKQERPADPEFHVLLSLTRPDILWRVRVELAGGETMADLRNLIADLVPAREMDDGRALSGETLEIVVGARDELTLHPAHVHGLTQLLRQAVGTIGARSTPGGGRCFHCDGTGRARPLWEPAAGQA